jgi:hypothetical protein
MPCKNNNTGTLIIFLNWYFTQLSLYDKIKINYYFALGKITVGNSWFIKEHAYEQPI